MKFEPISLYETFLQRALTNLTRPILKWGPLLMNAMPVDGSVLTILNEINDIHLQRVPQIQLNGGARKLSINAQDLVFVNSIRRSFNITYHENMLHRFGFSVRTNCNYYKKKEKY